MNTDRKQWVDLASRSLPNVCGWNTGSSGLIRFSRSANSSSLA